MQYSKYSYSALNQWKKCLAQFTEKCKLHILSLWCNIVSSSYEYLRSLLLWGLVCKCHSHTHTHTHTHTLVRVWDQNDLLWVFLNHRNKWYFKGKLKQKPLFYAFYFDKFELLMIFDCSITINSRVSIACGAVDL